MAPGRPPRPTPAELAILAVLWDRGPQTVREVHDALAPGRGVGYTTVLKQLQMLLDKRLVRRRAEGRGHVYEAAVARADAERGVVAELIDHVFGGSAGRLVLSALAEKPASPDEVARIRELLDGLEKRR